MKRSGSLLIAFGILLLLGAIGLTAYNVWDGRRADAAAQAIVTQLQQVIPGRAPTQPPQEPAPPTSAPTEPTEPEAPEAPEVTETPTEDAFSQIPDREMPTTMLGGYAYIGILDIPSLNLSLPVMDTWDYDRLDVSPCRYSGTTYARNLVICAHNYPNHFSPIKYLPRGTELRFTDAEGIETRYQIFDMETIGPNDVEAMTTGDWDLTLFTCTTGGQTRAAVRCELIED